MKVNTMALRKAVQAALETVSPRVKYQKAKPGTATPYIVFGLTTGIDNRPSQDYLLDVDVWDKVTKTSSSVIEDLTDAVVVALDAVPVEVTGCSFVPYFNTRFSADEKDSGLLHRRVTFSLRVYFS